MDLDFFHVFYTEGVMALAKMMEVLPDEQKGIVLSDIANNAASLSDRVVSLYDHLALQPKYLPKGLAEDIEKMRTAQTTKMGQLEEDITTIWGVGWKVEFGDSDRTTGRDRLYAIKKVAKIWPNMREAKRKVEYERICHLQEENNEHARTYWGYTIKDFKAAAARFEFVNFARTPHPQAEPLATATTNPAERLHAEPSITTTSHHAGFSTTTDPLDSSELHTDLSELDYESPYAERSIPTNSHHAEPQTTIFNSVPRFRWRSSTTSYKVYQHQNTTTIVLPISMAQLIKESQHQNPRMTSDWADDMTTLPAHDGNLVIQTSDHVEVFHKLAGRYRDHQGLNRLCNNLEKGWCARGYNLPQEGKGRRQQLEPPSTNSGTFHLAYWIAEGQSNPVISADVLGHDASSRFSTTQTFLSGLSGFQTLASQLMKRLDPITYNEYKTSFLKMTRKTPEMCAIHKAKNQIFYGCAVVINKAVVPHRDRKDGGKVVMTVAGSYKGGDLVVGPKDCPVRMPYSPGDVIIMNSRVLLHGVMPFEGTRRGIVLFSHRNVLEWKPLVLRLRVPKR